MNNMDYGNLIREVVKTYELPSKLETRLVAIAERRVRELHLNNVTDVYSYVDYLVGRFNARPEDRLTVSLDAKVKHDSKTSFQEFLGQQDPNLLAIRSPATEDKYGSRIHDVVDILRSRLSEVDFGILAQLVHQGFNPFGVEFGELGLAKDKIIAQLPQIQSRIETVAHAYERGGRIVVPARPIVYVQFEPEFLVRYGLRKYNGNPLAIYREDPYVQGLSRYGLKVADQFLYLKLRQCGQIAKAIPETLSPLPQQEVKRIVEAHAKYKGNASKASKQLGHATQTIVKYWEEAGLEAQGKREINLESEVAKSILGTYIIHNGNVTQTSRNLHKSPATVSKYWKAAGLPIIGRQSAWNALQQSEVERILVSHETYHGDSKGAARNLPYTKKTIEKYWTIAGLNIEKTEAAPTGIAKLSELSEDEIRVVVKSHKTYDGRATKAASALHHDIDTILKYWKNAHLPIREQGDSSLSDEKVDGVVAAHRTYGGNAKKAARHLPYSPSTIRKYWREAGLRVAQRGESNTLPKDKIDEIVSAHALYNGNSLEASRQLGRSDITIRKYWRQAGLEPRGLQSKS